MTCSGAHVTFHVPLRAGFAAIAHRIEPVGSANWRRSVRGVGFGTGLGAGFGVGFGAGLPGRSACFSHAMPSLSRSRRAALAL